MEQLPDAEPTLDGVKRRLSPDTVPGRHRRARAPGESRSRDPEQPGLTADMAAATPPSSTSVLQHSHDRQLRLSKDQRAVVLTDMNQDGASLSLVYFPGSASLREKPYYEEILQKLGYHHPEAVTLSSSAASSSTIRLDGRTRSASLEHATNRRYQASYLS